MIFTEPRIVLGLWPIAGITTVGVTDADARQTIATALDEGIRTFDTAFSYGYDGQSDRFLGEAIRHRREECFVIGKVGQRWTNSRERIVDARPETLCKDAETSLRRIGIERLDCLMLHSVDPSVAIEDSAAAMASMRDRGLCKFIGVCNVDSAGLSRFESVAGCDAVQCPLNMVQCQSQDELIPHCQRTGCDVHVFWTLMKGLLAGRISRDHVFAEGDSRPSYPIFQGEKRQRIHDQIDRWTNIANDFGMSMSQLAVGWAMSQPGVTAALVGARRPEQIRELAAAKPLPPELLQRVC